MSIDFISYQPNPNSLSKSYFWNKFIPLNISQIPDSHLNYNHNPNLYLDSAITQTQTNLNVYQTQLGALLQRRSLAGLLSFPNDPHSFHSNLRNPTLTNSQVAIDVESHSHMTQIIFLEILVSSAILIDVLITRIILGKSAYKNPIFWIDIALFVLVILGISFYGKKMTYIEQDIDLGFILTRYAFQLLRLILYIIK